MDFGEVGGGVGGQGCHVGGDPVQVGGGSLGGLGGSVGSVFGQRDEGFAPQAGHPSGLEPGAVVDELVLKGVDEGEFVGEGSVLGAEVVTVGDLFGVGGDVLRLNAGGDVAQVRQHRFRWLLEGVAGHRVRVVLVCDTTSGVCSWVGLGWSGG